MPRSVTYISMDHTFNKRTTYNVYRATLHYKDGKPNSVDVGGAERIGTVVANFGCEGENFHYLTALAFETWGWPAFSWELKDKPEWRDE